VISLAFSGSMSARTGEVFDAFMRSKTSKSTSISSSLKIPCLSG
jgi:hypothetical protein